MGNHHSDIVPPFTDLARLCIHTITTKPLTLKAALHAYASLGAGGITIWREALNGQRPAQVARQLSSAGLKPVALCRGGFFPGQDARTRTAAINENKRLIAQAAELGVEYIVLVCGAVPGMPLETARRQIADGIAAIIPNAEAAGVKLGIEPLHPMYADARSAINTLKQANDLCARLDSPQVGVVVDVYHLWWDPDLQAEIQRSGRNGWLLAYHISDWKSPTQDLLNDRGLMGEGCIPLRQIRSWVEAAGFSGYCEVEIFSNYWWRYDQMEFLQQIIRAFLEHA